MPSPLLVFDLDGTLVDSAPDLIATLNIILAREGVEPFPYEQGRNLIGGGARILIQRAMMRREAGVTDAELDRMFGDFIEHYTDHIADRSLPFPGVDDTLDRLAGTGYRFAVCTNKLEKLARLLLDAFALTPRFDFICGQDTFAMKKPDPQVLRLTIDAAGGDPGRCFMIGDSITDISTARAAKIPVIAVDFGYSETPVAELGPDRVIGHFRDLPDAIAALSDKSLMQQKQVQQSIT